MTYEQLCHGYMGYSVIIVVNVVIHDDINCIIVVIVITILIVIIVMIVIVVGRPGTQEVGSCAGAGTARPANPPVLRRRDTNPRTGYVGVI